IFFSGAGTGGAEVLALAGAGVCLGAGDGGFTAGGCACTGGFAADFFLLSDLAGVVISTRSAPATIKTALIAECRNALKIENLSPAKSLNEIPRAKPVTKGQ